ncbi:MAG: hypothetical protein EOO42_16095, partial [Flavobacteriales bacterium]
METIIKRIPVKGMRFKDIMDLHGFNGVIPSKFIINKRIPGLGCTSNELESKRNSIIIAPFTAIIEVKEAKYGDKLFPVYGEYDIDDVINDLLIYLNNDEILFKDIGMVVFDECFVGEQNVVSFPPLICMDAIEELGGEVECVAGDLKD